MSCSPPNSVFFGIWGRCPTDRGGYNSPLNALSNTDGIPLATLGDTVNARRGPKERAQLLRDSTPSGAPLAYCGFDTPLREHSGLLNHHSRNALTFEEISMFITNLHSPSPNFHLRFGKRSRRGSHIVLKISTGHECILLLLIFQFSFFLWVQFRFFLLFPIAFIFFSTSTHGCFSFTIWNLFLDPLSSTDGKNQPPPASPHGGRYLVLFSKLVLIFSRFIQTLNSPSAL